MREVCCPGVGGAPEDHATTCMQFPARKVNYSKRARRMVYMREQGWTWRMIAAMFNISPTRVAEIVNYQRRIDTIAARNIESGEWIVKRYMVYYRARADRGGWLNLQLEVEASTEWFAIMRADEQLLKWCRVGAWYVDYDIDYAVLIESGKWIDRVKDPEPILNRLRVFCCPVFALKWIY
jgi:hypothetical protein